MTKTFRNLTLTLLAGSMVATAGYALADDRGGKRGGMMKQMLEQVDANSDGAYSEEELTAFISERFTEADANNDEQLSSDEIAEAMQGRRGREQRGERMLKRVDINEDGAVTLAEVTERATKMFALMDVDNSGTVEEDELPMRGERRGKR